MLRHVVISNFLGDDSLIAFGNSTTAGSCGTGLPDINNSDAGFITRNGGSSVAAFATAFDSILTELFPSAAGALVLIFIGTATCIT